MFHSLHHRNQKDKLYHILTFCEEQLLWKADEISTLGVSFVRCICDALWYNSHHHVFASRGCPIPEVFAQFQGYNLPQMSKQRKRTVTNMTSDESGALAFEAISGTAIQLSTKASMGSNAGEFRSARPLSQQVF